MFIDKENYPDILRSSLRVAHTVLGERRTPWFTACSLGLSSPSTQVKLLKQDWTGGVWETHWLVPCLLEGAASLVCGSSWALGINPSLLRASPCVSICVHPSPLSIRIPSDWIGCRHLNPSHLQHNPVSKRNRIRMSWGLGATTWILRWRNPAPHICLRREHGIKRGMFEPRTQRPRLTHLEEFLGLDILKVQPRKVFLGSHLHTTLGWPHLCGGSTAFMICSWGCWFNIFRSRSLKTVN